MDLKSAKEIIAKTARDYDTIAKEWDLSRNALRPYQIKLAEKIKFKEKVLDIGCGNGVLYDVLARKSIEYTGLDISKKLLVIAEKRLKKIGDCYHLTNGDISRLPFQEKIFDWVLALAVLHHVPKDFLQKRAARGIYRVLKPGGRAIVSVWNLYTDYAGKKFKIDEQLKKMPAWRSKKDLLIPWMVSSKKNIQRYFYRFDKKELAYLFKRVGFKNIKVFYGDAEGNKTDSLEKSYNIILKAQK